MWRQGSGKDYCTPMWEVGSMAWKEPGIQRQGQDCFGPYHHSNLKKIDRERERATQISREVDGGCLS